MVRTRGPKKKVNEDGDTSVPNESEDATTTEKMNEPSTTVTAQLELVEGEKPETAADADSLVEKKKKGGGKKKKTKGKGKKPSEGGNEDGTTGGGGGGDDVGNEEENAAPKEEEGMISFPPISSIGSVDGVDDSNTTAPATAPPSSVVEKKKTRGSARSKKGEDGTGDGEEVAKDGTVPTEEGKNEEDAVSSAAPTTKSKKEKKSKGKKVKKAAEGVSVTTEPEATSITANTEVPTPTEKDVEEKKEIPTEPIAEPAKSQPTTPVKEPPIHKPLTFPQTPKFNPDSHHSEIARSIPLPLDQDDDWREGVHFVRSPMKKKLNMEATPAPLPKPAFIAPVKEKVQEPIAVSPRKSRKKLLPVEPTPAPAIVSYEPDNTLESATAAPRKSTRGKKQLVESAPASEVVVVEDVPVEAAEPIEATREEEATTEAAPEGSTIPQENNVVVAQEPPVETPVEESTQNVLAVDAEEDAPMTVEEVLVTRPEALTEESSKGLRSTRFKKEIIVKPAAKPATKPVVKPTTKPVTKTTPFTKAAVKQTPKLEASTTNNKRITSETKAKVPEPKEAVTKTVVVSKPRVTSVTLKAKATAAITDRKVSDTKTAEAKEDKPTAPTTKAPATRAPATTGASKARSYTNLKATTAKSTASDPLPVRVKRVTSAPVSPKAETRQRIGSAGSGGSSKPSTVTEERPRAASSAFPKPPLIAKSTKPPTVPVGFKMPGEEFARKQAAAREEREQRRKEAEEKAASQPKSQTTAVPKREPVKAGFKRASPPATGDLPALGTLPKRRVSASRLTENTPDAQLAKENASAGTRKPSGSGSSIPPVVRHRAVPPPAAPKPQPRTLTGVKTAREQAAQKEKGIESKKPTVPVLATKAKSSDNLPEAEKARLIARKRTMETIKAWETQKKGQLPNQKQPIGNQNIKPAQVPVAATVVEAAAAALSVDAATPAETS